MRRLGFVALLSALLSLSGCSGVRDLMADPRTWQAIGAATAVAVDVACPGCREQVATEFQRELGRALDRGTRDE